MLPLDDIKVLDLSIMYAGPGTATYLGDMGADVIKIEQLTGDDSRRLGSSPYLADNSRFYMAVNRNKRAMSLDLQTPAGKEIIHRLAKDADIVLHNFRPGVAERLSVDYPTLNALNERLVYVWMTGFGSRGPYADKQAYDNIIQGYAGVYDARNRRYGDPSGAGTFISDTAAPMLLGFAIGAALWSRERTGHGQLLEGSLLGVALASQASQWVRTGDSKDPGGHWDPEVPEDCCLTFVCNDDQYLTVGLVADQEWQAFCNALKLPELAADERFASAQGRARHREFITQSVEGQFREDSRDAWLAILSAAEVPSVPLVLRADMKDLPHAIDNELFARIDHPVVGSTVVFQVPVRLSETPGTIRTPAPVFGQNTDEILGSVGYSAEEIERLRTEKVVA